jgi:hypothetical protein
MKHRTIFPLFLSLGVCLSCANACRASAAYASGGNEMPRKTAAGVELAALMFRVESGLVNLAALTDAEYISLALKVCALVDAQGKVTETEHYFRNRFSRAPLTLNDMVHIITETDNAAFGWQLSTWQDTAFHAYGEDGAYNLKFISRDGHFEAVYNKDGALLTADNDPLNMGTFNYGDYQTENMKHLKYDVWPYFTWNNTREAATLNWSGEKTRPVPIDKHPQAMARYREYAALLERGHADD